MPQAKKFPDPQSNHFSFWTTLDLIDLIQNIDLDWKIIDFQDVDDKVGNGFALVMKKESFKPVPKESEIRKKIDELRVKVQKENAFPGIIFKKARRVVEIIRNTLKEGRKKE